MPWQAKCLIFHLNALISNLHHQNQNLTHYHHNDHTHHHPNALISNLHHQNHNLIHHPIADEIGKVLLIYW